VFRAISSSALWSFGVYLEAVGDQTVGLWHVELGTPISLRNLVENQVPILPPVKIRQQHQRRVGDEQNFPIQRGMFGMIDDVRDHTVAGFAVDRTETPHLRRQAGEVVHGLVDQKNARLGDQNLLAQLSQTMSIPHGSVRLRTAAQAIYIMNNQMPTLQFKRKTRKGWRHLAGFSTGVWLKSGLGLIADPMMTSQHRPVSLPPGAEMPNGIYLYLYQIGDAEVELNRYGSTEIMWDGITSSIGVFVPHDL
jgi:hypothetical protein